MLLDDLENITQGKLQDYLKEKENQKILVVAKWKNI